MTPRPGAPDLPVGRGRINRVAIDVALGYTE